MIELLKQIFDNSWSCVFFVIAILSIIVAMYNKIKYACLKAASEAIAKAERREDLTGNEKFDLATDWIEDKLPSVFANNLIRALIEKLLQMVFKNMSDYTKTYIKRKTGYDISEVVQVFKEVESEESKE